MRVFTDGAEFRDLLFWSLVGGSVAITTTAANVRSGSAAYRFSSGSQYCNKNLPSALSEFYFKLGYKRDGATSGGTRIPAWFATSTELGSIRLNTTTHFLEHYVGTTLTTMGTIQIPLSAHCVVEVHVKIGDAPNGIVQTKVDGILDIDFAGDTKPGADTAANMLQVYSMISNGMNIDDLALNDTSGGVDDSWCGDGRVGMQTPNAAGDVTGLTPSSGNNYECVDDFPNDGETSYVRDIVIDDYDLYNLTPCGLTDVEILRVWAEARAREENAVGGLCRLGLKTEATEYWSAADLFLLTSYAPVVGTRHSVNPNTSLSWTIEQLDALQAGFKVR